METYESMHTWPVALHGLPIFVAVGRPMPGNAAVALDLPGRCGDHRALCVLDGWVPDGACHELIRLCVAPKSPRRSRVSP